MSQIGGGRIPRLRRRRPRRASYWDGIQFASTALTTTDSLFELVGTTRQEFMPSTVVRILGDLSFRGVNATVQTTVTAKIMYVEVNDAQTMTGDHSSFDTHEEDIAQRQFWNFTTFINPLDEPTGQLVNVHIDVKGKVKLDPAGKKLLVLLIRASGASSATVAGYVRVLTLMGPS